jgi:molybdopterin-guanine dinucleotide biosynthesis protein A
MNPDHPMAGVILTGGQSRRMGRVAKATVPLAGKPLLQHVIDRVAPQVQRLVLSVESYSPELADFGLEQVADPRPGHAGPLGGLLSALELIAQQTEWLLLVPCDAPFLPLDLGRRLQKTALDSGQAGCVVRYGGEVQPTFSVWNRSLLPSLEQAVCEVGLAGFKQYLDLEPQPSLDWDLSELKSLGPSPFFNINDPVALKEAEIWLTS